MARAPGGPQPGRPRRIEFVKDENGVLRPRVKQDPAATPPASSGSATPPPKPSQSSSSAQPPKSVPPPKPAAPPPSKAADTPKPAAPPPPREPEPKPERTIIGGAAALEAGISRPRASKPAPAPAPAQPPARRPAPMGPTNTPPAHVPSASDEIFAYNSGLVVFALILSVILHVAAAFAWGNKPLAQMNLDRFRDDDVRILNVKRAPLDVFETDEPDDTAADATDKADESQDLEAISEALLARDDSTPPPLIEDQAGPELRDLPEQRPDDVGDAPSAMPEVDLAALVEQANEMGLDIGLMIPDADGAGSGSGSGGTGSGGPGQTSGEAGTMIASARVVLPGSAPSPRQVSIPKASDREIAAAVTNDERAFELPDDVLNLDFSDTALDGAKSLAIPESLDNDFDYRLTTYQPPREKKFFGGLEPAVDPYFRLEISAKRSLRKLHTMPKDVVFLIDISGSVPQRWVDQILKGVRDSLGSLNEDDRFNIVFFAEQPIFFSTSGMTKFSHESHQKALEFLTSRKSEGYTDVNSAISRLLVRDLAIERVYNLVLISDGRPTRGVMSTRELINLITRDNDLTASIYCVGVTEKQNRELLEFLAYRNKGLCVFIDDIGEVASGIRDLISRLRFPIMRDISLSTVGLDQDETYPLDIPNIHQGETFAIYGRFKNAKPFTVRMIGHNGQKLLDFTVTRDLARPTDRSEEIMKEWAFWKLHNLYNEMLKRGENEEIKKQIDQLRDEYKLKTLY